MSIPEPSPQVISTQQRLSQLLEIAVALSQASGGAIWVTTPGQRPQLLSQQGLGNQRLDALQSNWPGHQEKLNEVVELRTFRTLNATFQADGIKPHALQMLLLPILDGDQIRGVLELFLPVRETPSLSSVTTQLESLLRLSIGNLSNTTHGAIEFSTWIWHINKSLEFKATTYALANETRRWSHWDRVSVAILRGGDYSISAISGLDLFDRRSGAVRELESLANSMKEQLLPIVYPAEHDPETALTQSLENYAKRVNAVSVAVLPLAPDSTRPTGLLVFENFHENPNSLKIPSLKSAQAPASLAVQHALDYESAKSNILTRTLRNTLSKTGAKTLFAIVLLGLVAAALTLLQTDLVITGTGVLQPEIRKDLYAGTTGIVEKLHVEHGQHVRKGDALLTLRSPDLELEISRITGEQTTIEQQISDLETLRSDPRRSSDQTTSPAQQAAQVEELKAVLSSLNTQLELLEKQQQDLIITSPIEGMILTWNINSLLQDRPVNRSDRLLSIAKLDGPWVLELQVDHRDIGPVVRAVEKETARVNYVTANAPEVVQQALIKDLSPALTIDPIQGPILKMTATIQQVQLSGIQPGTTVIPRIQCGKSSVGYVWFRRFIDRTRAWWVLW